MGSTCLGAKGTGTDYSAQHDDAASSSSGCGGGEEGGRHRPEDLSHHCMARGGGLYASLPSRSASHASDMVDNKSLGPQSSEETLDAPPLIRYGSFKISKKEMTRATMKVDMQPDHSYSGVAFNVYCKKKSGQHIFVNAFEISGMLGHITIWATKNRDVNASDVYNNRDMWLQIHDGHYKPSWHTLFTLELHVTMRISPGEHVGFYIHSACRNDRGIKYRSCRPGKVMEDQHIIIKSGWAHTSFIPFDENNGWYRVPRVLSGNVMYSTVDEAWSPQTNHHFPTNYQLCAKAIIEVDALMCSLPPEALLEIVSFCSMTWFDDEEEEGEQPPGSAAGSPRSPSSGRRGSGRRSRSLYGFRRYGGGYRIQDPWEAASDEDSS